MNATDTRILLLLKSGAPRKQIADQLSIPIRTMERRIDTLRRKFQCANTIHLVAFCIENGVFGLSCKN